MECLYHVLEGLRYDQRNPSLMLIPVFWSRPVLECSSSFLTGDLIWHLQKPQDISFYPAPTTVFPETQGRASSKLTFFSWEPLLGPAWPSNVKIPPSHVILLWEASTAKVVVHWILTVNFLEARQSSPS